MHTPVYSAFKLFANLQYQTKLQLLHLHCFFLLSLLIFFFCLFLHFSFFTFTSSLFLIFYHFLPNFKNYHHYIDNSFLALPDYVIYFLFTWIYKQEPVIGWLVLQEAAVPASHYPRPRRLGFTNYDYYIYEATFRCVQYLPTRPRSSARY